MFRAQRGESNLLADRGIASPPAAARNVTVENFLPQQGWGRVEEFKFPEGKIHYHNLVIAHIFYTPIFGQRNSCHFSEQ
jgi:hypothetical protein